MVLVLKFEGFPFHCMLSLTTWDLELYARTLNLPPNGIALQIPPCFFPFFRSTSRLYSDCLLAVPSCGKE